MTCLETKVLALEAGGSLNSCCSGRPTGSGVAVPEMPGAAEAAAARHPCLSWSACCTQLRLCCQLLYKPSAQAVAGLPACSCLPVQQAANVDVWQPLCCRSERSLSPPPQWDMTGTGRTHPTCQQPPLQRWCSRRGSVSAGMPQQTGPACSCRGSCATPARCRPCSMPAAAWRSLQM